MRVSVLAFFCGVLVVQFLAALPTLWWALLLVPALLLCLRSRLFLPLLFLLLGFHWAVFRAGLILDDALPPALEGRDLHVEGFIADLPDPFPRGSRFDFAVERATLAGAPAGVPARLRLSSYDPAFVPRVGDRWRLLVRLKRPHGFQNPGGFDYEAYLFRERIRATGYVRAGEAPALLSSDPFDYPIGRFRQRLGEQIRTLLPGHPFAGVLVALVNGDRAGIGQEQWQVLRRTGTAHLVAISGMHIGFVAGLVFLLVRALWSLPGHTVLRLAAPRAAAIAAMVAAAAYAALAGFAIPTQRALIMVAVVMGGLLAGRRAAPSHVLAVALFLVLLHDPLAVIAVGFWLSFASVGIILLLLQGRGHLPRWHEWGRLQWSISLGLFPLMIVLFQQVPLASPVANLLAIPVIQFLVVPLSLVGAVLVSLSLEPLAAPAFTAAAAVTGLLWQPLAAIAGLDALQWFQHAPAAWALVLALVGALWLLAPRGWPARGVGALWLLPLVLARPPSPAAGEVRFTLLDVGQGLSAVVRTQHHTLVFDAGARFSPRFNAGEAVVVPYLRARGVRTVDVLMVSHGDNDHIGGAPALIAAMPVGTVFTSVPERFGDARPCRAGQAWQWDGVDFQVVWPANPGAFRGNNAGCVLLVRSPHGSILLPGDLESRAERELVALAGETLAAQILVAPHHGSRSSSTPLFVDAARPALVLFPVGYRNPYRHPHPQVVGRYQARGVQLHDSPAAGAIEIELGAAGAEVTRYREAAKRYWFAE